MKYFLISLLLLTNYSFSQNTIFWEVSHSESPFTSYILGTYHFIGNSYLDTIPVVLKAIDHSDIIHVESMGQREKLTQIINSRPVGYEIKNLLKRKDYEFVKELSKEWKVSLDKLSYAELNVKLYQEFSINFCNLIKETDEFEQLDNYIIHLGEKNNKKIVPLELDSMQLEYINQDEAGKTISQKRWQLKFLIEKHKNGSYNDELCNLSKKYVKNSVDYEFNKDCPDDILVKERNRLWLEKLPTSLKDNNCFVAVGLKHLFYKCGLLEALKAQGFIVKPIIISTKSM